MSILDKLVEEAAPVASTFTVQLINKQSLEFRYVQGADEMAALKAGTEEFIAAITAGALSPQMKPFATTDKKTLGYVYSLNQLCVTPEESQLSFLQFASKLPFAFEALCQEADAHLVGYARIKESKAIDEAKKE